MSCLAHHYSCLPQSLSSAPPAQGVVEKCLLTSLLIVTHPPQPSYVGHASLLRTWFSESSAAMPIAHLLHITTYLGIINVGAISLANWQVKKGVYIPGGLSIPHTTYHIPHCHHTVMSYIIQMSQRHFTLLCAHKITSFIVLLYTCIETFFLTHRKHRDLLLIIPHLYLTMPPPQTLLPSCLQVVRRNGKPFHLQMEKKHHPHFHRVTISLYRDKNQAKCSSFSRETKGLLLFGFQSITP